MSVRANVIRRTLHWRNIRSDNCPFGELSFGELSVGELSVKEMPSGNCPLGKYLSGKSPSGKCPSGNCPDTDSTPFGNLEMCYWLGLPAEIKRHRSKNYETWSDTT